jgi:hypothetical protein
MAKYSKTCMDARMAVKIHIDTGISFWQAIKLRVAGKNYEIIAKEIAESIKRRLEKEESEA